MKRHPHIIVYFSAHTHSSDLTKEYFRQNGYEFEEVDVDKETAVANKMFSQMGKKETPVTDIDGRITVGYRPDVFEIILNRNGDDAPASE